jgi:hypothetical protein
VVFGGTTPDGSTIWGDTWVYQARTLAKGHYYEFADDGLLRRETY